MSKQPSVLALYELRISVQPTGLRVVRLKSPMKFTGLNYVPVPWVDAFDNQGFNYRQNSRVPAKEILAVQRTAMMDGTDHVSRSVYYLEGQEQQAKELVKAALNLRIQQMKEQMDLVHTAWITRKERP